MFMQTSGEVLRCGLQQLINEAELFAWWVSSGVRDLECML